MYSMIEYTRHVVSKIKKPQLGKEAREVQGVTLLRSLIPVFIKPGA